MPRNVRNFWIDLDVDGQEKPIGTGPKNKEGGFSAQIFIRSGGAVEKILSINGRSYGNELSLSVDTADGKFLKYTRPR